MMQHPPQQQHTAHASVDHLTSAPHKFDFWQAMRVLQHLANKTGELMHVKLSSHISNAFPPSDVHSITATDETLALSVNFIGLAGAHAPLPMPITETVLERAHAGDTALQDFLDIFNQRIIQLFYDGMATMRPSRAPVTHPATSEFADVLYAICGMQTSGLRSSTPPERNGYAGIPDGSLLQHAPLFAMQNRSAAGLERILRTYFDLPITVHEFHGAWFPLEPEDRTHIGFAGQSNRLGDSATLGKKAWNQEAGICIEISDLTAHQYREWQDKTADGLYDTLQKLVRFYTIDEMDCFVRLVLKNGEMLEWRLGEDFV